MSKCTVSDKEAIGKYEGYASCGQAECEFEIQVGIDYIEDK